MNTLPLCSVTVSRRLCKIGAAFLLAAGMLHAASSQADALDNINKNGKVRIGVFMDYPPFGSIGPDMKPLGYDIDMADLIGRALKTKVELVQSNADLGGKTISVARGTLEDLSISKIAPADAVIKRFDDPNGAISAFL
eukprot:gene34475-40394_t